MCNRFILNSY